MRIKPKQRLAVLLAAMCAAGSASQAATFTANFNDGATPPGVTLYDPAKIVATGGVGNSGYLSLTDAVGSLNGTIIIDDFANGAVIGGFTARMKIQISGGGNQPADGFSFSFGSDLPDGPIGEEGSGTGLRVVLDTYDNGAGEAPALDVFWNNLEVAHTKFDGVTVLTTPPIIDPATGKPASLQTGTNFMDLVIDLHPNGTLDVSYKGITVYKDLVIPDYNPTAGRFGIGARTGGSVENHWVDDLSITTVAPITGKATVKNPPVSITVNERSAASFSVVPDGAPPFTFQWSRNGTDIPEATSNILALASAAMTDNGAKYKVKITNAGGSVESTEAVLTVTPDTAKPAITSVTGSGSFTEVNVTFSEAIEPVSAANKANYTLDGGLTVTSAEVVAPNRVKLTTAKQTAGATYKLTVNGVKDTAATANTIEAGTVKSFAAFTFLRGGLKFEAFYDIAGTAVQGLLDDPKYLANNADVVGFVTQFTSRLIFTDGAHENYGGRLSGFIVPPESAQYEFFLRSDDGGQLYLSTDDKPENATMIAEETGCCGAFEDPGMPETSAPQVLVAGKQYYIMALWKEGGGGDYCDIAWRKVGDPTLPRGLSYIPGSVLETLAPPGTFTPPTASFASPANDSSFEVGAPVTLTANAVADPTKTIAKVEFFELGKLVGTATASPYSIVVPNLSEDAHKFTVKVTDSAGIFTESAPITISIGGLRKKVTFLAIDTNTVWRYDRSGQDLGTEWRAKNYDDSKWPQGKALIADETTTTVEPIRTAISRLTDDGTYIKTFYFRTHFNFPGAVTPGVKLQLRHVVDDGAIFYLNGVEIHRLGITANPVDATSDATSHENVYEGPFDISLASLVSGDNVLTAEVHQSGGSSSDMVFGAELVATIPAVTATILAIDDKTIWRYDRSGQDLGSDWRALGYDDSKWPQGKALIADETTTTVEPIRTAISRLTDDGTYIKTFYFRHVFNFDGEVATAKLKLRHVVDDGAIFYLNGVEINRLGITANPADATSDATSHENVYEGPFDVAIASLKTGANILAAEVHQSGGSSSDMVFGAELVATYFGGSAPVDPTPVAPKFSSIKLQSGNLVITWTGTGTLQGADTVAGPWSNVANASSPFSVASPTASKFYRLRQ